MVVNTDDLSAGKKLPAVRVLSRPSIISLIKLYHKLVVAKIFYPATPIAIKNWDNAFGIH